MRPEILQEYHALVASHFVGAESDALARQNLARLAQDLRRDMKSIVDSIDQNPEEENIQAYLGVMFYEAFTSPKVKLIRDLSRRGLPAAEAIAEIRRQSALQIAKPALEGVRWLETRNVEHLWTAIQLVLTAPAEKTWADQVIQEDEEETNEDTDHE